MFRMTYSEVWMRYLLSAVCWRTCRKMCLQDKPSGVRMTLEWSVLGCGMCHIVLDVSIVHIAAVLCSILTWKITLAQHWVPPIVLWATQYSAETRQGWCSWRMRLGDHTGSAVDLPCVTGIGFWCCLMSVYIVATFLVLCSSRSSLFCLYIAWTTSNCSWHR